MSVQSTTPLSPALFTASSASGTRKKHSIAGLSLNGSFLFVTSLLVVASGFSSLRPVVMGLALHPCLVPVGLALPLVLIMRLHTFPVRVLVALLLFTSMYSFSALNGGHNPLGEVFKTGSALVTVVTCALLVRRRGDFVAGALGLSIAIALLAVRALDASEHAAGVNVMAGMANKNSYSLFALPAILLAGYIVLNLKIPVVVKTILISSTVPALVAIFMGGNRSGYLGAVLIGLMLFWDRRGKGLLMVGLIAASVAFYILQFGSTVVLNERLRQTVEGKVDRQNSDTIRRNLILICLEIGLENPLIGVGPQMLPWEIGRHTATDYQTGVSEAHNVYAHVFAGSGAICFAALIGVGWSLCAWKPRGGGKVGGTEDPLREARRLMRMLVFLWFVRAMFTAEILYNPAFNIALGLAIGLCILAEDARNGEPAASSKPSPLNGQARLATGH
jgi:hypothetical protein